MDNVIQVTAGGMDITLALKSDGTLWASGKGYGPAFIKVMDGVKTPGQEQQPTEQERPQQPEKPNETTEAVFTDVPANHWAHDYVEKPRQRDGSMALATIALPPTRKSVTRSSRLC